MTGCLRYAPMIGARPGELSGEDERGLAEHAAACAACQGRLADEAALAGMLSAALLDEANRRDFTTFSDEVLARIPACQRERGPLARLGAWARRHRAAAIAGVVAPALVAAALFVYLSGGAPERPVVVEVSAEGQNATVLETREGPVVLFGDAAGT